MDTIHTIGRRKTAVARIYMSKGKGNITVNNREAKDYFTTGTLMYKLNQPFGLVDAEVRKFNSSQNLKVPHFGWNSVESKNSLKLTKNCQNSFYFAHSYFVKCRNKENILSN